MQFGNVRMIHKATPERYVGYVIPQVHIYRVQSHKRFLCITYWKTIVETTDCWTARAAFIQDVKKMMEIEARKIAELWHKNSTKERS